MTRYFITKKIHIFILNKYNVFKHIFIFPSIIFFLLNSTIFFVPNTFAKGNLTIPSTGSVIQPFLSQILPDTRGSYYDQNDQLKKMNQKFHSGVDISNGNTDCSQNLSPVYAAAAGKIIYADYDTSGFGWSVRISHGLSTSDNNKYVYTIYAHMGTPNVKRKRGQSCLMVTQGQDVFAGQLIGYQGSSGRSTGTHLHWGTKVNPVENTWQSKDSKWASPDFYTCLALTEDGPSSLENVNAGQNICGPTLITQITVGANPYSIGVNPVTNFIYVANQGHNNVSVIDGNTNILNLTIPVGRQPNGVAINFNTNKIYVGNGYSDTISIIDGQNNTNVATINFGGQHIALNTVTNLIYTGSPGKNYIMVIDGTNNTYVTLIPVGTYPSGIAINTTTNRIYVANEGSNTVTVIDGSNNNVIQTISVGSSPQDITVNPITNRIYVTNNLSDNVSVIDGLTNTIIDTILLPPDPGYIATRPTKIGINPTTNHIFVGSDSEFNSLFIIDGNTNNVMTILPGHGYQAGGIGINSITNHVYISHVGIWTVSVFQDY